MRLNNRNTGKILFFLIFIISMLPINSFALNDQDFIVEDLKVTDIPEDDGSGLMISWKPLLKEQRIIEYRVYRGTTPDSMFFVQKIDVNVKTGVSGDVMYYYDKDFNYFLTVDEAPGKLKKEKGQPKDTKLYRNIPRDLKINGPQLKNYDILGVIEEKDFYYHSQKIEVQEDDKTNVYAGLKLRHVDMYKKLKADKEYFYNVIAVNEARKYFLPAETVSGFPRDNAPEKTKELVAVLINDLNKLQFEWSLPLFIDGIQYHTVYYFNKSEIEDFNKYIEELDVIEKNNFARKADSTIVKYEASCKNPAKMIFRRNTAYPYTSINTGSATIQEGKIVIEKFGIDTEFNSENISEYLFVFSLSKYSGYETFSDPIELTDNILSSELPDIPPFKVVDRKNDKGDYNNVLWGKPVVNITGTSFLNEMRTKMMISYEYNTNIDYKVHNIFFEIYDSSGNMITRFNEYYQDNKIIVKVPENTDFLTVKISFKCNKELGDDYIFTQNLIPQENSNTLKPDILMLENEDIDAFSYKVYKRNLTDSEFRLAKKMAGAQREQDDFVNFDNKHFKLVGKFDLEKGSYLISSSFLVKQNYENESGVSSNLFVSEVEKTIKNYQDEISKYTSQKDTLTTEEEIKQADETIEHYQNEINNIQNNPILKTADAIKSHKSRVKYLAAERTKAKRNFEYKIIKSDGKACFTESIVYVDAEGNDHFIPISNWFKGNMLPALFATLIFGGLVFVMVGKAKKGHDLFIRPIAGLEEIDNAIGRATEMGRPILFVPGLSGISDVATLAALAILGRVAKKAAEYDTRILVPVKDYIVLPIAQEIVKEAHYEAGRPDTYDKNSVFFITTAQFAFVAGVNGIMIREKTATNFYMGMFFAEALIMAETGSSTGAIQIAGTDAITQIPFFITTCDYTLIGEELYAASAYLAREPLMLVL